MSLIVAIAIFVALIVVGSILPTVLVYRRHKGKLSIGQSHLVASLHLFRAIGWVFIVIAPIFALLILAGMAGRLAGTYPWWSVLAAIVLAAVGYVMQRLATVVLNDQDFRNMFVSSDE